ncbi:hypothetical protein KEM56_007064 [Ascosphaera pollenicola]|nr:hypothetical protein KEM56_007064 [Ascosphaera pollenicola]
MSSSADASRGDPQTSGFAAKHTAPANSPQDVSKNDASKEPLTKQPDRVDSFGQGETNECQSREDIAASDSAEESGDSSPDTIRREKKKKGDTPQSHGFGVFFSGKFPWVHYGKRPSDNQETSTDSSTENLSDESSLERMVSEMFGEQRKQQSEGYKTLHKGVVWKDLKVYGSGLGAVTQRTNLDTLMYVPTMGCRAGFHAVDGSVTYGGTPASQMAKHYRSEVIYNPENDSHYAGLSVRRVLSFAIVSRTPPKESRLEEESRTQYRNTFLRAASKLFWIEGVLNTKIGNNMIRGVSGGEKRRVSIAETMVTRASIQCWDNSTRGLDASTAQEYVNSLRSMTNHSGCSTMVSLYQASETLFKKFDKVMVINEGRCAYFGKASDVRGYFEGLGFECPPRWTTPDFVTTVSDVNARRIKKGYEDRIPRSSEDFEQAYNRSSVRAAALNDMHEFEQYLERESEKNKAHNERAKKLRKNYSLPLWHQALILTKQQYFIIIGTRLTLLGKWCTVFFLAWIVGSLFYDMPRTTDGLFTRGGCLFYIILFNCLMALAEISAAFEYRPVVQKHRMLSMYRPAAFALAQVFADIPQIFVQITIFDIIVYFLSGLSRTASQFFICFLFTFMITMVMYSFFRAIASVCSSLDVATRLTGVSLQALIVYTGYFLPPSRMRPWLHWFRWVNPISYAFEAVVANEFYDHDFGCTKITTVPQGPGVLQEHQTCLTQGSQPGQVTINGQSYIMSNFGYTRSHLWRNFGILIGWLIFWIAITMVGMETQKPSEAGKTVIVYKKGGVPEDVQQEMQGKSPSRPNDEEKNEKKDPKRQSDHTDNRNRSGEHVARQANETEQNDNANESQQSNGTGDSNASNVQDHSERPIFTWQNINYFVPVKKGQKQLLKDVQGYVRPGRLTCMIGASGAGKTTLLNALAQRLTTGSITGDCLVDGKPLPISFKRNAGYAQQADIHEPALTVRESLQFSAYLRRPPSVPLKEKYDYCEQIIDLLELRQIADAVLGTENSGLNAEQRKRVTIAVELASKPELLLFLDEPTSGLDSLAAFNVARLLRKLTDSGQAVFATIHQPSAVLFEQFDELYLLQAGGRLVYHGELGKDSRTMIDYFERNGAKKCPPDANPAEYMLEVIGAGDPNYKGKDWADVWANSEECKARTHEIEEIVNTRRQQESSQDEQSNSEYAMPFRDRTMAVTKRAFVANWRTPDYATGKFLLCIFCGLFNTFTFWHVNHSIIDFQSRLFSIFMLIVISPPLCQQLQPRFLHFRGLYEARESQSRIYSWLSVIFAAIVSEIPYALTSQTVYFCCWYFGCFFPRDHFSIGYSWMMTMLFSLYYTGFGQILAAWSPNELFASLLVPALITPAISFCGVVVPYMYLPSFWRWWMYWIAPFHYLLEGLLSTTSHRVQVKCTDKELARFTAPRGMSCEQYAGAYARNIGGYLGPKMGEYCTVCPYKDGDEWTKTFNVYRSNKWRDFFVFMGFVLFNFAMVMFISWLYLVGIPRMMRRIKDRRMKKD